NSIRHGFDTDEHPCDSIVMPEITMTVYQKESLICLEVSDNGCGIDIQKANAALTPPPSGEGQKQHVGLHNIYQRLTTYYGNVSITFETIPYYKNTVRITLPKKG
ncbi:MAG: hypothetical protein RR466_11955, partial [Hungatella sp.]